MRDASDKILTWSGMIEERNCLRERGLSLVFTNGCFDLLHVGHVRYLQFARRQGDRLLVGLNSDCSVRRSKPGRPIVPETERAVVLSALECIDYVVIFSQDEPAELIARVVPDVLVKGADWAHYISGRDTVEGSGGRVVLAEMVGGWSTTDLVAKIRAAAEAEQEVRRH